jgi:hypothetical protein
MAFDLNLRFLQSAAVVNDDVGQGELACRWGLGLHPRQCCPAREFPRANQAGQLLLRRASHNPERVNAALHSGLDKFDGLDDDYPPRRLLYQALHFGADRRMHYLLQGLQSRRVVEDDLAQPGPLDGPIRADDSPAKVLDYGTVNLRPRSHQAMGNGISVNDAGSQLLQHAQDGALPGGYVAGEADDVTPPTARFWLHPPADFLDARRLALVNADALVTDYTTSYKLRPTRQGAWDGEIY